MAGKTVEIPEFDELYEVLDAKVKELERQFRGQYDASNRNAVTIQGHGGGLEVMMEFHLSDGTVKAFYISVYRSRLGKQGIETRVKRYSHNNEDYWESQISSEPERRVVVDGVHYRLGKDGAVPGKFQGFGGRRFDIEFFDGRQVTTYDLWYQGRIPAVFRDQLPDNARFIERASNETAAAA